MREELTLVLPVWELFTKEELTLVLPMLQLFTEEEPTLVLLMLKGRFTITTMMIRYLSVTRKMQKLVIAMFIEFNNFCIHVLNFV